MKYRKIGEKGFDPIITEYGLILKSAHTYRIKSRDMSLLSTVLILKIPKDYLANITAIKERPTPYIHISSEIINSRTNNYIKFLILDVLIIL